MRRYIGARWGGSYTIRVQGHDCKPGDVCTIVSEEQAQATPQWTPLYEMEPSPALDKGTETPNPAPEDGATTKKSGKSRGKDGSR